MGDITHWFVRVVYWSLAVLLYWASLKYVLQVLLAPILSNLSVAVERKLWGREPDPFTVKEYLQDMGRSLLLSIRNSVIEIVLCLFVGFLPGIGQVGGIVISSYFYGFGYMDYVLERKKYNIPQAVAFVRQHKGLAIGLGCVAALMMLVPVIGWVLAPTYATVAATLETLRIMEPSEAGRLDLFVKNSDQ
jgi:CysZ protein